MTDGHRRDAVAQWAFDTRPLLLRFHLWLEDVEVEWRRGQPRDTGDETIDFVPGDIRRCLAMTAGVTALGTRLFAPFGEARGADASRVNQVKKDADAISAYVMSEALWHFTRKLPENHAIMVCLGEGLMPKSGETPEMGANPLLGFGRVYARPEVARFIDRRIHRLLNDPRYSWSDFYGKMKERGITIWGAAIDTLENTSRFARGEEFGPMTVLHLFDQPLVVTRPYESYVGSLAVPGAVTRAARDHAIHVDLLTPRRKLVEAIELALPGIRREHIHVWTLAGNSRRARLSKLWSEWRELQVHLVEDGWRCPSAWPAFTESGTYAPAYLVSTWTDEGGAPHVFLCDGYAASAEALQAASLSEALDLDVSMAHCSPAFECPVDVEYRLMHLDPDSPSFEDDVARALESGTPDRDVVEGYRRSLRERAAAHVPRGERVVRAGDFLPEKTWRMLAATGFIGKDPYTGLPGVERLEDDLWAVTSQLASGEATLVVRCVFRLLEPFEEQRLVFSPLLERFIAGEDYRSRPVKVSDSGRIRNELQTLCSQALEYADDTIIVHFDGINDDVILPEHRGTIRRVLEWYKERHPVWFSWLELD
jgi:hypothetical protein